MAKKTRKFSEFIDGNSVQAGDETVGLRDQQNYRFDATTGGGGTSSGVSEIVTQANAFNEGDWVRFDGGTGNYVVAQANSATNAEGHWIAIDVTPTQFTIVAMGPVDLSTSGAAYLPFNPGDVYFLDETNAGRITNVEPTALNEVSKPVLVAITTTKGWVIPMRGEVQNGGISPTATSGGNNGVAVNQMGHGFSTNDAVRVNGAGTYTEAIATSFANSQVAGLVEVVDADNFIVYPDGYMSTLSALTANTLYYLSDTTLGAITPVKPTSYGSWDRPVLYTDGTGSGYVLNWRQDPISGDGENIQVVSQAGHPFTVVGQFAKPSGVANQYDLAQADSLVNSRSTGMIIEIPDANTFVIQFSGYFDFGGVPPAGALVPGDQYWLSNVAAGGYTNVEPAAAGTVSKPVLSAISTQEVWILEQRPMLQPNANGGSGGGGSGVLITSIDLGTSPTATPLQFNNILDGTYSSIEIVLENLVFDTTNNLLQIGFGTGAGVYGALVHDWTDHALYYAGGVPTTSNRTNISVANAYITNDTIGIRAPAPWGLSGKVFFAGSHSGTYKQGYAKTSYNQWGASIRPVGDNASFQYRSTTNVTSIQFVFIGTLIDGQIKINGFV